jgi:hypothetical protein
MQKALCACLFPELRRMEHGEAQFLPFNDLEVIAF